MPLSSRSSPKAQKKETTFQWAGPSTPQEYNQSNLTSRKDVQEKPSPAPVSSRVQPRSSVDETKKRLGQGKVALAKEKITAPFKSLSSFVTEMTPVGPALLRRAENKEALQKKNAEAILKDPGLATAKKGDGIMGAIWKNSVEGMTEAGLDLMELSTWVLPITDYETVKNVTNNARARAGLPPEQHLTSRREALSATTRDTYATVTGFLKGFKEMGLKTWEVANITDPVERRRALGQYTQDIIDGVTGAVTLGIAAKVQAAEGFTTDETSVYYKGEKIRDLSGGEKEAAGAGKVAGSVLGSMVAWRVLSPFAGKQALKAMPSLKPLALKHPYLFQITAANLAEESLQLGVSKVFNVPYTLGDTFTGMMMQFGFETFNLGKASRRGGSYDPLGLRAEQARLWDGLPQEMKDVDYDAARTQLDKIAEDFVVQNKRIPTDLEMQELVGDMPVAMKDGAKNKVSYNDLHNIAAKEWMSRAGAEGENRLLGLKESNKVRPEAEAREAGLFAGEKAETFGEAKGKFSSRIDRMTRFEISDLEAPVTRKAYDSLRATGSRRLVDIINHPKLFEAYPKLKDVQVVMRTEPGASGRIDSAKKIIIDPKANPGSSSLKYTLLHEIQHLIQGIEGFENGGNAESVASALGLKSTDPNAQAIYRNLYGEVEARQVEARSGLSRKDRSKVPPGKLEGTRVEEIIPPFARKTLGLDGPAAKAGGADEIRISDLTEAQRAEADFAELETVRLADLELDPSQLKRARADVAAGELSTKPEVPIKISRSSDGKVRLLDGYHRYVQALNDGKTFLPSDTVAKIQPSKAPRKAEGGESRLGSRKKPLPPKKVQPKRTSRLRDRLAKAGDSRIEDPKQANIVKFLEKEFTANIRRGGFKKKALGVFKPGENVIRTQSALDINTSAHEIGHYLDSEFGLSKAVKKGNRYLEPYRSELLELGKETSRASYTTKQKVAEGLAEFTRRYIIEPETLKTVAPSFKKYFDKQMPPEALRLFKEVNDAHNRYLKESPEYRVKSHISTEPPKTPIRDAARNTVRAIFTALDDRLAPMREFVKRAETAIGEEIKYKEDPYVLARSIVGLDGKTLQWIAPNLKPFDGQGKFLTDVRSLGDILKDVKNRADFEAYLVSKRAQDLHKTETQTGIKSSDADDVVRVMEQRHPNYKKIQREVVGWNRALLNYAKERGFLSADQVKEMTANGENYVPFFRVIDEITRPGGSGKKFSDISSPFKRLKGSTRQIVSPIESMTKNAYVIMSAVDRNNVGQALVRLAKRHPDLGSFIEEVPAGSKPVTINAKDAMKKLGIEGDISETISETITLFTQGNKPNMAGENIMMVVDKGKPKYYSVDPFLYKSIADLGTEGTSMLIKLLQKPASTLRAGATLTPEFMGRNPFRDQFTAFIYSRSNYIPFVDLARGIVETFKKGESYQRTAIGGGMQSAFVSLDRPALKTYVEQMFRSRGETTKSYVTHPIDALRALSEFGELGTRVGEAKKVFADEMQRSGDYEEALVKSSFAARNVTLDFGRKGTVGKTINQISAFWNASVQDITKFGRELGGLEKGTRPGATAIKALTSLTVPSLAFHLMSKDDERYKELPRWQRDYFWVAAIPGAPLIRIPKPFLPGLLFGSLPVRMLEAQEEQSLRPLQDFFISFRENTAPNLLPTAMAPVLEYATNYSFFFSRNIVPQDEIQLLPPDQYGIYTSETYKKVGKVLNKSPRKIESLVYGYTAGLGRYAAEAMDFLGAKTGVLEKKPVPPKDITQLPVVRAFTISDLSTTGQSVSDFYDQYRKSQETYLSFRKAFNEGDTKRGREIMDKNISDFFYVTPDGNSQVLYHGLGAAAEVLSELKQERERIITSTEIKAEKKSEVIRKLNEAIRLVARQANDATKNRQKTLDGVSSSFQP